MTYCYATDIITKCDSYFITKYDKGLLQNASVVLLQNATVLLQNVLILLQNAIVVTKCNVYYKMRRYKVYNTFCLVLFRAVYFHLQLKISL